MSKKAKSPSLALHSDDTLNVLESMPSIATGALMRMREIILDVGETDVVGGVEETLKWNQPAYLPRKAKVGTTIRLGFDEKNDRCVLYGHCQSTLIDQWRDRYADTFEFVGNRALTFSVHEPIPEDEFSDCVWLALTYHTRSKKP